MAHDSQLTSVIQNLQSTIELMNVRLALAQQVQDQIMQTQMHEQKMILENTEQLRKQQAMLNIFFVRLNSLTGTGSSGSQRVYTTAPITKRRL